MEETVREARTILATWESGQRRRETIKRRIAQGGTLVSVEEIDILLLEDKNDSLGEVGGDAGKTGGRGT